MLDIKCYETPIDELCEDALKHYLKLSDEACHYDSLIPSAIETYRKVRKYYEELQKEYDEQPIWAHGFDIHTPSELNRLRVFLGIDDI